ncbi:MAG: bifunctional DNA-formamidopyrimidine glycosylase/DNA-(apurinic or apyrimidinic site) lyase [Phycisphaerae bacterium]|nr:bifunctional DNA-formamidopyrimidine glycosylase/DNA-(apurinic or apyrimidinic site) lyase [Phycisphaerae bacterium]
MPELPEVETIVAEIRPRLVEAVIRSIQLRPDYLRTSETDLHRALTGRRIAGVSREGKWIVLSLVDGARCVLHLGMSGRLTIEQSASEVALHTHFVMRFQSRADELRLRDPRRFGGVWYWPPAVEPGEFGSSVAIPRLGPDALNVTASEFSGICRRAKRIKALLLDQSAICGLGNIYCDEALFDAKIHPDALASGLATPDVRRLACSIRKVLRKAIEFGGSSLRDYVRSDGRAGEFQRIHRVYGREGLPCPRCGAAIVRKMSAGRSTHFCARCQSVGAE